MYVTYEHSVAILESEGVRPHPLPDGMDRRTNLPDWSRTANEAYTSDVAFFWMLTGTRAEALDYSDFEGAEHIADLNRPLPEDLRGRFGLVVDVGTLEHVFDVRQGLQNIASLLKPSGRVIHFSPASNYVNHGFYSFSPTLFFDYYGANGFEKLEGYLVRECRTAPESQRLEFFEFPRRFKPMTLGSRQRLSVAFLAQRSERSTMDAVPLQGYYDEIYGEGPSAAPTTLRHRIGRRLPEWTKALLKTIPGVDRSKPPWGLKLTFTLE